LFGKHDYALQRLLLGNALRRNEVSQLSATLAQPVRRKRILGKGRGTQAEVVDLGAATV
jgi:integrase/recombinase XerC